MLRRTRMVAWVKPNQQEPSLERQIAASKSGGGGGSGGGAGNVGAKGPPTAHPLPNYKRAHILIGSTRWKTSNLTTNVASGKGYSLRESHGIGNGSLDPSGQYRDWLVGEERRFANMLGVTLFCCSASLWWYTVQSLSSEQFDVPLPLLNTPPPVAGNSR